ncbi:MAG: sporulation protein YunB [Firmicutes bacterium]|nr:sporulation protein YunB [Bacillota bacterium]
MKCSNAGAYKLTRRKKRIKPIVVVAVIILIAFAVWLVFSVNIPLVTGLAEARARVETLNAINDASIKIRNFAVFHQTFFNYEKNLQGEVVLVSANTSAINQLYILAQAEVQRSLNALTERTVPVSLGAFSGISLLSGVGPPINIRYNAIGYSEALWNSYFYNEGINQTIHRVILSINTTVKMLIPFRASDFTVSTDIIIAEDLVIGRVPEFYLSNIRGSNPYNLLP